MRTRDNLNLLMHRYLLSTVSEHFRRIGISHLCIKHYTGARANSVPGISSQTRRDLRQSCQRQLLRCLGHSSIDQSMDLRRARNIEERQKFQPIR
jgi:hypothetical protein